VAGKPELFDHEPEVEAVDDRVLVAFPDADHNRGRFTVASFRDGLIVRMEDFDQRRKAENAVRA
jgi:hypothetical protein